MPSKLKILQLVSSLGMGGAEMWLLELTRYWKENNVNIQLDFLLTSGKKGVLDEAFSSLGCNLFYYPLNRKQLLPFTSYFRSILKQNRYDALHSHLDILSGWYFALGIKHLPPIRVAHFHSPSDQWSRNYGVNRRRRFILKAGKVLIRQLSTHIRGTSNKILNDAGVSGEEFTYLSPQALYCGVDLKKWILANTRDTQNEAIQMGWPNNAKIILFAGRFDGSIDPAHPRNQKNSAFALEVFAEAARQDPSLRMFMVGANEFIKDEFLKLMMDRNVQDKVALLGIRRDLPDLMHASDLLLFPSKSEGLGMVAVEAQAVGLPVLASTGVPSECVVFPNMVNFLSLTAPIQQWANKVLELINLSKSPSEVYEKEWERSPFNLKNSAETLLSLYSGKSVSR